MRAAILALALLGCTPLPQCPDCPKAPTQATREVCIDEAFADDVTTIRAAVARWDAALCGVVRVTSRVVDPLTEPCSLTVLRVDPSWQWVQSRPRDALAWTDTDRGIAWVLTPARDIESIAAHEIGHLLGADHATLTRYPTHCVSHGSAVQAGYSAGRDSADRTTP
jgi:hypothetical protein